MLPHPVHPGILAVCRNTGWELYRRREYLQAEIVGRGLVAADDGEWYHHCLLAATLLKLERVGEALAAIEAGLAKLPAAPELLTLRTSIVAAGIRLKALEGPHRTLVAAVPRPTAGDGPFGGRRTHYRAMVKLVAGILDEEEAYNNEVTQVRKRAA